MNFKALFPPWVLTRLFPCPNPNLASPNWSTKKGETWILA